MSELKTIKEMADRLRVEPSWLYARTRKRGKGTIPMVRVGKYIRFREDEVLRWLEAQQRELD